MPSLATAARLAKSLAGGGILTAAARSPLARELGRRAITDPGGLLREVADPAKARVLVGRASHDPGLSQLPQAALIFLPFRYLPVGYVALWAGGKVLGRYVGRRRNPATTETRATAMSGANDLKLPG